MERLKIHLRGFFEVGRSGPVSPDDLRQARQITTTQPGTPVAITDHESFTTGALRSSAPSDDVIETPLFDDLLRVPWVVPRKGTPTRDYFNRFMANFWDCKAPYLIEAGSLILIRGLLVESDNLAMISA